MSGAARQQFQNHWKEKAERLDRDGYFSRYTDTQRDEVLRKGYLGQYAPDQALAIAKQQVRLGISKRTPQFIDNMRDHFQLVGEEVRDALLKVLDEIPPESYKPPKELKDPPGLSFEFRSKNVRSDVYFKFQILGTTKKPMVLFWSCHPPVY